MHLFIHVLRPDPFRHNTVPCGRIGSLVVVVESVASKTVLDPHPAATAGVGIIGVGVFLRYSICLP